jgi:hypothetical protein
MIILYDHIQELRAELRYAEYMPAARRRNPRPKPGRSA